MEKRILVTEEIDQAGIDVFESHGFVVDVKLHMSEEELFACVGNYDALIVRSHTKVSPELLDAAKKLKVVGRAGVSVDNIDIEAATERGVIVCNAPNSNLVSAAELAIASMLACARNIPQNNTRMHNHIWEASDLRGIELYEKTLAIFGLGRVGGLVAQRAASFGMKMKGYDPYCSRERAASLGVEMCDTVSEAIKDADFITLHMPKTVETIGMFGPEQYAEMKDGVILVNVARGGIFDEKSLSDFVAAGKIRAVALDTFAEEPCTESALHEFDNAILMPKIGANTDEAMRRAGIQIANYVVAGLTGSIVPTALNMSNVPPEIEDTIGTYATACEMMGKIIAQIDNSIPQELTLRAAGGLSGADRSVLLASTLKGILSYKNMGAVTPTNAEAVAKRHGIRVESSAEPNAGAYASSLSITADEIEITCTMFGAGTNGRIISLFGYRLDIEPAEQSLVFEYVDAPGRMGIIGTLLGEANVNITTMQIGKREGSENSVVFMNIEGDLTPEVVGKLRDSIDGLENLWYLKL